MSRTNETYELENVPREKSMAGFDSDRRILHDKDVG